MSSPMASEFWQFAQNLTNSPPSTSSQIVRSQPPRSLHSHLSLASPSTSSHLDLDSRNLRPSFCSDTTTLLFGDVFDSDLANYNTFDPESLALIPTESHDERGTRNTMASPSPATMGGGWNNNSSNQAMVPQPTTNDPSIIIRPIIRVLALTQFPQVPRLDRG